jgi:hypothetical protein
LIRIFMALMRTVLITVAGAILAKTPELTARTFGKLLILAWITPVLMNALMLEHGKSLMTRVLILLATKFARAKRKMTLPNVGYVAG